MTKKIVLNLTILTITILFFSSQGKAQEMKNMYKTELENGTWITDNILGLDPNIKQYNLTKFIERKFAGNLTSFGDKMVFNSSYVAPCGNDNFTTVIGKYEFFDKEKIIISVDTVSYSGEWEKPTEHRKPKEIIFLISKVDETIVFTKQSE
ncbi:hypothetical protein [Aquimarina sp. 2201CG14-23]|uniref:hypothetical protein n=1 Tax=Aquimarina mycalae TaxID=3040073 RepID=UPI00247801A1|nr:hypothetical protein [Aquimarina sp. 2201CG14-23]MDH7447599.1 hypothetical protein [Aquimarina sp. 2201CG14-23]